ncbi:MAG TPA: tetratricopeptide repeat protein [Chryseolinea sp.]|nr:tetratricopeptide repeat protein [Chryseolinea sp.]
MSSLLPGFEYDIFISYRHNDNRSGWVTEFVKNLEEELAATIKDPVSVYFDSNPHDGLHENHDVDDSLRTKLKCIILIPILSQTYCDTRSFAWKHEFIVFRQQAGEDNLGLKVKVGTGNVSSRILPVCIHALDPSDKQLVENELGGMLRGIEFIYESKGISRPLKASEEDAKANLNHTYYRDQVAKVARAVKEILSATRNPSSLASTVQRPVHTPDLPARSRKKIALVATAVVLVGILSFTYYYFGGFGQKFSTNIDKSIAVLPFHNLSEDTGQDYFSNGIAEDILNHLNKISELKVKSRSSTVQYKDTKKSIFEIGKELGVGRILDGSVRRVGNMVRVTVQLIDASSDNHLWSETYDRELKDILAIQSEIAMEIAKAMRARLTTNEKKNIESELNYDVTAYDYFLKSREMLYKSNIEKQDYEKALFLVNTALKMDPKFARALSLKGRIWFAMSTLGVRQKTWYDSAMHYSSLAMSLDPSLPESYVVQAAINRVLGNHAASRSNYKKAYQLSPNDPLASFRYGRVLLNDNDARGADLILKSVLDEYSEQDPEYYTRLADAYLAAGDIDVAEKLFKKAKSISPGSMFPYYNLGSLYRGIGNFEKAANEMKQAEKINPGFSGSVDQLGWIAYMDNELQIAASYWSRYPEFEAMFEDTTQTIPFRHRLGMTYLKMGKKEEADALFAKARTIQTQLLHRERGVGSPWGNYGSIYYDLAVITAYYKDYPRVVELLDSALIYEVGFPWGYLYDPLLDSLRNRDDFKRVLKKVTDSEEFTKAAFRSAISRMEASKELKTLLK